MQKQLKRCYLRNCEEPRTIIRTRNWKARLAEILGDGGGRRVHSSDEVAVNFKLSLVVLIAADPDIFRTVMESS